MAQIAVVVWCLLGAFLSSKAKGEKKYIIGFAFGAFGQVILVLFK